MTDRDGQRRAGGRDERLALSLLAAALTGAGLGGAYLGLLWAAVRRLPQERGGVAVFVAARARAGGAGLGALAAAAVLGVPAAGIVAALLGFVAVRVAATRLSGRGTAEDTPMEISPDSWILYEWRGWRSTPRSSSPGW
jgi:hypothetical protein